MENETVRHGIDNDPNNDAKKGAELGGVGGAAVGAAAGSVAGPVGTVVGAVAGGVAGAVASGAAVGAVDRVDNDDTITGMGGQPAHGTATSADGHLPGIQTGGRDADGTPDTRGIGEKIADAVTGDRIDDKTGKPVA